MSGLPGKLEILTTVLTRDEINERVFVPALGSPVDGALLLALVVGVRPSFYSEHTLWVIERYVDYVLWQIAEGSRTVGVE
ncbi:MAG: hypothetical protein ACYCSN_14600 [Acidobacteriaceae bacterium]